jgi:hypothetical protein
VVRIALVSLLALQAAPLGCDRGAREPATVEQRPPNAIELTPDSLRDQVLARIEQYYVDFSARNWTRYAEHFWPQATLTTVWQPTDEPAPRVVITSLESFIEQAPLGPGSKPIFEEQMTSADVWGSGNLAQVLAHYRARFGEPGNVQEWTGIDAFTLLRHDGQWRIVSLTYANDPGAPRP